MSAVRVSPNTKGKSQDLLCGGTYNAGAGWVRPGAGWCLPYECPLTDCANIWKPVEGWKVVVSTETEETRENDKISILFNNVYTRRDDE